MRMAPDEFVIQVVEHVGDGEMSLVGGHFRIKQHLQQQVAQFLGKVRKIAALDGVEDFVGLFQRVFPDGVERLLAIPGASVRGAQPGHDAHRLLKKRRRTRRIGHRLCCGGVCIYV